MSSNKGDMSLSSTNSDQNPTNRPLVREELFEENLIKKCHGLDLDDEEELTEPFVP